VTKEQESNETQETSSSDGDNTSPATTDATSAVTATATVEETKSDRGNRKTLVGVVVSDKMNKTRIVKVQRIEMHRRYKKYIRRDTKYAVHDEDEQGNEISKTGDKVLIQETRPYSKTKRWRVVKVLN
jgi:small subunit ribosomal protein S17